MSTRAYSYLRMSSSAQIKGDSLRRQLEQSRAYCEAHSLQLVEDMRDIGISAFHGKNVGETAALGRFIQAVEDGKVEKGSLLLIENFDRLSRQDVFTAFSRLSELVKSGIKVVTLMDDRVYDSGIGLNEMLMSILTMQRAHEESVVKSRRGRATWKNKRANAGKKPVSRTCPAWLRPKADGTGFEPDKDRVRVVRRIYRECADHGLGVSLITKGLNRDGIPVFATKGKRGGWYNSYVQSILRNRAVLGEYQGHERIDGKRRPEGELHTNYYPDVIDSGLWFRAQAALNKRRIVHNGRLRPVGGRKGEGVTNVFQKIITCSECGSALHVVDRGNKGGRALVCDGAIRGAGVCQPSYWTYEHLEVSVLTFVKEINLSELLSVGAGQRERDEVEKEIRAAEGRIEEINVQRERAYQLVVEAGSDYMKGKLMELDLAAAEAQRAIVALAQKRDKLAAEAQSFEASREKIADLVTRAQDKSGPAAHKLRSTLAAHLRDLVDRITVSFKTHSFTVRFKDGTTRVVLPDAADPTKFVGMATTQEGLITDYSVRGLLAQFGFVDPTLSQYDEMVADLGAMTRRRVELGPERGDEAGKEMMDKWEKRRVGPDQSREVETMLFARFNKPTDRILDRHIGMPVSMRELGLVKDNPDRVAKPTNKKSKKK